MVNAEKQKVLNVINTVTAPERQLKQLENNKKKFNKTKYRVNSNCNFYKNHFDRLEEHYNMDLKEL